MIPHWAVDVLTGIGAGFLWCAAIIAIVLFIGWAGKRRSHGDHLATQAPAPGHPRVPAPTPVPGQRTPGVAAKPPPRPAPAPGPSDPHGGTVTTIDIHRCGRMVITDWDKGEAEIHHGECETCTGTRCYLCGFYLRYDPGRGQWVPRYERCPAHEEACDARD